MIKPIGGRILIKKLEQNKVINGIFIPDSAIDETTEAMVVSVGPGKKQIDGTRKEIPLKPGDKIVYDLEDVHEVSINGEKHIVIEEKDFLAKIVQVED